jgi:hypothetical protein
MKPAKWLSTSWSQYVILTYRLRNLPYGNYGQTNHDHRITCGRLWVCKHASTKFSSFWDDPTTKPAFWLAWWSAHFEISLKSTTASCFNFIRPLLVQKLQNSSPTTALHSTSRPLQDRKRKLNPVFLIERVGCLYCTSYRYPPPCASRK